MSSYGDMMKDMARVDFVQRWTEGVKIPQPTEENLRWNIARARAAEAELDSLRAALRTLRDALS